MTSWLFQGKLAPGIQIEVLFFYLLGWVMCRRRTTQYATHHLKKRLIVKFQLLPAELQIWRGGITTPRSAKVALSLCIIFFHLHRTIRCCFPDRRRRKCVKISPSSSVCAERIPLNFAASSASCSVTWKLHPRYCSVSTARFAFAFRFWRAAPFLRASAGA